MNITVCTITPIYKGEKYIKELIENIAKVKKTWESTSAPMILTEAILVDDGSVDSSSTVIKELTQKYAWVTAITMSRNFGQHSATIAGICHSSSDWIVTLDEDLQHDPKYIDILFDAQSKNQSDVVYANPTTATHGNSWRDKASKIVKRTLARLSNTPQVEIFNSYRLIRGSIARAASSACSSQTYLDIAISWFTISVVAAPIKMIDTRYIVENKSSYSFSRLFSHARKLMVSSSFDIASKGLIVGLFTTIISIAIGLVTITLKILHPELITLVGWASLVSISTFLSGMILSLLCIILEYISVIVANQLGKPTFFSVDRSNDIILEKWFLKPIK